MPALSKRTLACMAHSSPQTLELRNVCCRPCAKAAPAASSRALRAHPPPAAPRAPRQLAHGQGACHEVPGFGQRAHRQRQQRHQRQQRQQRRKQQQHGGAGQRAALQGAAPGAEHCALHRVLRPRCADLRRLQTHAAQVGGAARDGWRRRRAARAGAVGLAAHLGGAADVRPVHRAARLLPQGTRGGAGPARRARRGNARSCTLTAAAAAHICCNRTTRLGSSLVRAPTLCRSRSAPSCACCRTRCRRCLRSAPSRWAPALCCEPLLLPRAFACCIVIASGQQCLRGRLAAALPG